MEQLKIDTIIPSCDLLTIMSEQVEPYLESICHSFEIISKDGNPINGMTYTVEHPKGTIMISHGFTESVKKYTEMIYYFVQNGFDVCIHDHRNHGYSRKEVINGPTHVDSFQDYIEDFDEVVNKVVSKMTKPTILYAHSMGGCIGATYIEQHPSVFSKAIFSSPLFEVNRGNIPYGVAKTLARILCMIGKGKDYLPGQGQFSNNEDFEHSASNCKERYLYYFQKQIKDIHLQNNGSSCRWTLEIFNACEKLLSHCDKINIPILLMQADKDDFVLPGGHDIFLSKVKNGKKLFFPNTKHEIYLSDDLTLKHYILAIQSFLNE